MSAQNDTPPPELHQCFDSDTDTIHYDVQTSKLGPPRRWYVHRLLPHLQGVRHPTDDVKDSKPSLVSFNPYAATLRDVALGTEYEPLRDTSDWKQLLDASMDGDLKTFESMFLAIRSSRSPDPLQPAACLAAVYSNHGILRFCFENGATFDNALRQACNIGSGHRQEMWEVMIDYDYLEMRTSLERARTQIKIFKDHLPKEIIRYLQERCYPLGYDEWEYDPMNPKNFRKYNDDGRLTQAYIERYMPEMAWK